MSAAVTKQGVRNLDTPRNGRRFREANTVVEHACDAELVKVCAFCKQSWSGGTTCKCTYRCKICRRDMKP